MQRDMSYELDDVFSTRNAGELIEEQVMKTRVLRTPGLRVLATPQAQSLDPALDHSLSNPLGVSMQGGFYAKANDLAGDINLPFIGAVSTQQLALGALAGGLVWFLFLRK